MTAAGASDTRTGIAPNHARLASNVAVTLQEQVHAATEPSSATTIATSVSASPAVRVGDAAGQLLGPVRLPGRRQRLRDLGQRPACRSGSVMVRASCSARSGCPAAASAFATSASASACRSGSVMLRASCSARSGCPAAANACATPASARACRSGR